MQMAVEVQLCPGNLLDLTSTVITGYEQIRGDRGSCSYGFIVYFVGRTLLVYYKLSQFLTLISHGNLYANTPTLSILLN